MTTSCEPRTSVRGVLRLLRNTAAVVLIGLLLSGPEALAAVRMAASWLLR